MFYFTSLGIRRAVLGSPILSNAVLSGGIFSLIDIVFIKQTHYFSLICTKSVRLRAYFTEHCFNCPFMIAGSFQSRQPLAKCANCGKANWCSYLFVSPLMTSREYCDIFYTVRKAITLTSQCRYISLIMQNFALYTNATNCMSYYYFYTPIHTYIRQPRRCYCT